MGKWGLWLDDRDVTGPAWAVLFDKAVLRKRRAPRRVIRGAIGLLLYGRPGAKHRGTLDLYTRPQDFGRSGYLGVVKRRGHCLLLEDGGLIVIHYLKREELWTAF